MTYKKTNGVNGREKTEVGTGCKPRQRVHKSPTDFDQGELLVPLLVSRSVFDPGLPRNTKISLFRRQEACRPYVVGQYDVGKNGAQESLTSVST